MNQKGTAGEPGPGGSRPMRVGGGWVELGWWCAESGRVLQKETDYRRGRIRNWSHQVAPREIYSIY